METEGSVFGVYGVLFEKVSHSNSLNTVALTPRATSRFYSILREVTAWKIPAEELDLKKNGMKKNLVFQNLSFFTCKTQKFEDYSRKIQRCMWLFWRKSWIFVFFQLQNWEKRAFIGDKEAEKFKKDSEFVIKLLICVKFYVTNVENWTFFT